MIRVFISYSHDSQSHLDFVRGISDRLRYEGINCQIDQYINGSPPEGWQRWMENQIESADFVLMVCSAAYSLRYRGLETNGGKGATFEGIVVSQSLYDSHNRNTKFIPVLPENGNKRYVPSTLKAYNIYVLPQQYNKLYRHLTEQPKYCRPPIGSRRPMPCIDTSMPYQNFHTDRLPTVKGSFFGRKNELDMLDDAWKVDSPVNIMQFIAPGGTGKTKLLRFWLDQVDGIDTLLAWSFYSQGVSHYKPTLISAFFRHAFKRLGATYDGFDTDEEKGEYLARLLSKKRCLLVLDGLEPIQRADKAYRGKLKDKSLRSFLKSLAKCNAGLCLITTRISVHELSDREAPYVISHYLQNLCTNNGIKLLKSLGVQGSKNELQNAVEECGRHPLALNLLGNFLRLRYQGDVKKRNIVETIAEAGSSEILEGKHAFKIMRAYSEWFTGATELKLLYLLGLFDHPISEKELLVLQTAQIPNLTKGISIGDLSEAASILQEDYQLLSKKCGCNNLDCHPFIRDYFGKQLRSHQPSAWKQAHKTLHNYYKNQLPKNKCPQTADDLQYLFSAVLHGIAAGMKRKIINEFYLYQVEQAKNYLGNQLDTDFATKGFSDATIQVHPSTKSTLFRIAYHFNIRKKISKINILNTISSLISCQLNVPTNTVGAAFILAIFMGLSSMSEGLFLRPQVALEKIFGTNVVVYERSEEFYLNEDFYVAVLMEKEIFSGGTYVMIASLPNYYLLEHVSLQGEWWDEFGVEYIIEHLGKTLRITVPNAVKLPQKRPVTDKAAYLELTHKDGTRLRLQKISAFK